MGESQKGDNMGCRKAESDAIRGATKRMIFFLKICLLILKREREQLEWGRGREGQRERES